MRIVLYCSNLRLILFLLFNFWKYERRYFRLLLHLTSGPSPSIAAHPLILLTHLVFAALLICDSVGNLVGVFAWSLDFPNSQKVCMAILFFIVVV